jgi:hypothetical protein
MQSENDDNFLFIAIFILILSEREQQYKVVKVLIEEPAGKTTGENFSCN